MENIEHVEPAFKRAKPLLAEGAIDAVLLDLGLPDSQGLAMFEKIHSGAPQVPIVILTGLKRRRSSRRSSPQGPQDYLSKGKLDGQLLARALTYAVERKKT